jgi:hypothetical protein
MSLTIEQRINLDGVPKAAELIEISGAHALEASDRAILNLLYEHAHKSGRLIEPGAKWELPMTSLLVSEHESYDRLRDSLNRLMSVRVTVAYQERETGEERLLLTGLFTFFDIPRSGKGRRNGVIRYGVPDQLRPVLEQSSRWGRIKAEVVCAMASKYAMALYELVQLRANMDRCIEHFTVARLRDLLGVPPGTYERGNDFIKRVIDPAVLELNHLSEINVAIDVKRAYSRAPITGFTLTWWRKRPQEMGDAYRERQRSKVGRKARLRGDVMPVDVLIPIERQTS